MRRFIMAAAALLVVFGLTLVPIKAEAVEAEGEATLDVYNTYVWRGLNLGGNEGVVQPGLAVSIDKFSVGFWSDYDIELDELVETDITLGYSTEISGVAVEAGYIYYALDGLEDTAEVYVSAGFDMVLNPSLTLYYDFDEGDGAFLVASIGHSIEFGYTTLDLGASASVNFNNEVMGVDEDGDEFTGIYNGEVSAALNIPVDDNVTLTPRLAYTFAAGDDAKDAIEAINGGGGIATDETDFLYGGVGLSISF